MTDVPRSDVPPQRSAVPDQQHDGRSGASSSGTVAARAQKAQKIAYAAAVAIMLVFAAVALTLRGKTDSGKSYFHPEDQVAMIILGFLCAGAVLWFTRPRIIASADGIRVRNLLGWIEVPWAIVTAIRFDRGSPWASLELRDDDLIAIMAIQAADKEYAVAAVRALRALLRAVREAESASAI